MGRSPNGTVDHLSRRPTLENHVNRSSLAHQESASGRFSGLDAARYADYRPRVR